MRFSDSMTKQVAENGGYNSSPFRNSRFIPRRQRSFNPLLMKPISRSPRRKVAHAVLAPLALLLALPSAAARPDDAYGPGWSAVHADPANSDYHQRPGPSDLALSWSRSFDGMINLGPTSDGLGRVYVTTSGTGCRLHALDRDSGKTMG